jgi:hypothetical protein
MTLVEAGQLIRLTGRENQLDLSPWPSMDFGSDQLAGNPPIQTCLNPASTSIR